jgi:hypothetical protein
MRGSLHLLSLQKNVEHIPSSRDFTVFEFSKDVEAKFVEDVAFMDQICGDILTQVDLSPALHSPHLLASIAIQYIPSSYSIQAIQLSTSNQNIVFKVSGLSIFGDKNINTCIID